MKPIKVAVAPITNTIYAGHLLKDGRTWASGKQDVTIDTLVAVAIHATAFGKPIIISKEDGTPEFKITVECL